MAADQEATPVSSSPQPADSIEVEPDVKDEDGLDDAVADRDGDGESNVAADDSSRTPRPVSNDQYKALKAVADTLTDFSYKDKRGDDYVPSMLFRRIPNKRIFPDYHELIKEPRAISTFKGKIQRKEYTGISEYVRDFALIVHNAQVYNRPNSQPVKDVFALQKVFNDEMQKLVDEGLISQADLKFPDLGEIPESTPEPDPISEEEEEPEEDVEEDDEEDIDDSDDEKKRGGRRVRKSQGGRKVAGEEDDGKGVEDPRKRRGRPPRVDTPMESRIKAILKGIRKPKDGPGALKIRHFEKLPDKQQFPHYFQEIKEPIALDLIKRKAKRKKYQTLEQFMSDLHLMFKNAMEYNEDASDIYKDAADLLLEAQKLEEAERAKSDEEYMMEDGRLPLPNGILYKNELWKVGDWVHIENVNDVTKPIVAQIYRTWEDPEGQKWVNACWYYRPEQTVHHYEKHFYANEVVKTGQYRDHRIDEVINRCFVMFFTRYNRGRPRNLTQDIDVYVCEARYNEEKHKMNKIKTWASCLPDEVRDKDYEMDLFDAPRKIKKVPSPLLHLLKDDAKETEEVMQPEWGKDNAPPIRGGIHRGARDENQSPPPEPTPPPPPTPPPAPVRAPSTNMLPRPPSVPLNANLAHQQNPRASPSIGQQMGPAYHGAAVSPAPSYPRQNSFQQANTRPYSNAGPQTPAQHQPAPYVAQQQLHPPSLSAAHPGSYTITTPSQTYGRTQLPAVQASQYSAYPTASVAVQRDAEVYVLAESANATIPEEVRNQFPRDDQGRILFFTKPPVDTRSVLQGRTEGDKNKPLAHTAKFLAAKAKLQEREAARKQELKEAQTSVSTVPGRLTSSGNGDQGLQPLLLKKSEQGLASSVLNWVDGLDQATKQMYQASYGDKWQDYMELDELKRQDRKRKWIEETNGEAERFTKTANYTFKFKGRDPWHGRYEDDFDPRYGF